MEKFVDYGILSNPLKLNTLPSLLGGTLFLVRITCLYEGPEANTGAFPVQLALKFLFTALYNVYCHPLRKCKRS